MSHISAAVVNVVHHGVRIWITDTRFFKKQTTTRMTSNVVVEEIASFTMLQSLLRTYMKSDERIQKPKVFLRAQATG